MQHSRCISYHALIGFSVLFVLVLATGCSVIGDVPPAMRVDLGEHPGHRDEQVRFRTTYYFRIVDSCNVEEGKRQSVNETDYIDKQGPFRVRQSGKLKIVSDSLYRFRMTGKASALFANIRFESGVLRAEQIDPFGSQVVHNKDTNTFRVIPANATRENARRQDITDEIERLLALKTRAGLEEHNEIIATLIANQIRLLGNENDSGLISTKNDTTPQPKPATTGLLCPDGRPTQQSYFLYGPEGVRRLDPDERLLMAMSSDSKPLIGMLQQLSGKSLNGQQISGDMWKDLVDERVRVSSALRNIESLINKGKLTALEMDDLMKDLETHFEAKPSR
jgi:hypothetical protein